MAARPLSEGTTRRVVPPAVPCVCVAISVAVGLICAVAAHRGHGFLDLSVYRFGGEAVWQQWSLYDAAFEDELRRLPFTYPPFAALLMTVLAPVPLPVLAGVWSLLGVLALSVTVALSWREWPRRIPAYAVPLTVVGALAFEPVWSSLAYGQINLFLMLAVVADLLGRDRRTTGLLIGIAAGIKLTPLIFVVLLILVGRERAALTAVAGFIGTVAVGFLLLPVTSWTYWTEVLWDPGRVGGVHFASNQSVLGGVTRLLGAEPSTTAWFLVAGALALLTLLVASVRWRGGDRDLAVALGGLSMLLASPISWGHHWVWAVPAAIALARVSLSGAVAWSAVFVSACLRLPRSSDDVELTWLPWEQLVGNAYLWAALLLIAWFLLGGPPFRHARPLPWWRKGARWRSRPPASTGTPARSRTRSSRTSVTG